MKKHSNKRMMAQTPMAPVEYPKMGNSRPSVKMMPYANKPLSIIDNMVKRPSNNQPAMGNTPEMRMRNRKGQNTNVQ